MLRLMILASVLLLAGSGRGQDEGARYGFFGPTCSEPNFSFIGLPRIGSSFSLRVTGGSTTPHGFIARTNVVVLTGFSNTKYGDLPLPFSIGSLAPHLIGRGFSPLPGWLLSRM